jgi:hypothetical protein
MLVVAVLVVQVLLGVQAVVVEVHLAQIRRSLVLQTLVAVVVLAQTIMRVAMLEQTAALAS